MKQNNTFVLMALLISVMIYSFACSEKSDPPKPESKSDTSVQLPVGLFLTSAPDGVKPIKQLKESVKPGDVVVVNVIVGGRVKPIVEGRASAMIIDVGLENACTAEKDHCETPWDYCCTTHEAITANLATLQVVDNDGRVLAADLSKHFKPLSNLIVKGVVGPRPDKKVLQINATGIYVKP